MLFKEPLTEWFFVNQKWFFYGIAWIIFLFFKSVQCWLFPIHYYLFTFTIMHLADAFIQSDLQCIQAIHLYCQYMSWSMNIIVWI